MLLDFEISTTYAPLIGNPKKLSIPIASQEDTLIGPYTTSVAPYCYCRNFTVIVVAMCSPYCYYCDP